MTPIVYDAFTRVMAGGYREADYVGMPTLFQRFFGRPETGGRTIYSPNANILEIEIKRAYQKMAALVPRNAIGKFIGDTHADGTLGIGTTFARKYPLIQEELPLDSEQLLSRVIGEEGPYDNWDQTTRLRTLARLGYVELMRRILRLQEFLAGQSLLLGKQSCRAVGTPGTDDYDWRRNSSNTAALTHGWANALGVPLTDLDTACDQLVFAGKGDTNFIAVFGGNAMKAFLANTQVSTNFANKLYFELLRFSLDFTPNGFLAELVAAGAKAFGRLKTPKGYEITVLTYPAMYEAANGAATKFFNDDYAFVCSSNARCDRYFGPPQRLPITPTEQMMMMERFGMSPDTLPLPANVPAGILNPGMYYTDSYDSPDRQHTLLRIQGGPVYPTVQTDAFYTMTNAGSAS